MRPLIGTSTKMNLTSSEAQRYFETLCPLVEAINDRDLFVLPPFTSIWVARACLKGSNVAWGAQDVHSEDAGAHTGDISAPMLADLGCSYVEVGHSERRRDHSETDERVALKIAQILRHEMTPILCVGEPSHRPIDETLDFVLGQLGRGLARVAPNDRERVVVAYEPVWAIGFGAQPAAPEHVSAIFDGIHGWLRSPDGKGIDTRVIYGGSVDVVTAGPLLRGGVDGLFIGRAALDPAHFAAIAGAARDRVLASPRLVLAPSDGKPPSPTTEGRSAS